MILSLDLSTKSSGWSILNDKKELIKYGCITSASTDLIKRIHKMTDEINVILQEEKDIKTIVIEEVRPEGATYGVGNQKTHKALMWLQAAVAFLIHDNFSNINIEYTYPSSWRSILGIKTGKGIKRDTLKEADIEYIYNRFNISVNDDIADAICIGLAYLFEIENEKNLQNIEEINWG